MKAERKTYHEEAESVVNMTQYVADQSSDLEYSSTKTF